MTNPNGLNERTYEGQAQPSSSEGYLGSSLDLRAGLGVREVAVSALPHEVVSELARMRRSWPSNGALRHAA